MHNQLRMHIHIFFLRRPDIHLRIRWFIRSASNEALALKPHPLREVPGKDPRSLLCRGYLAVDAREWIRETGAGEVMAEETDWRQTRTELEAPKDTQNGANTTISPQYHELLRRARVRLFLL